jgi:hypothetical protein
MSLPGGRQHSRSSLCDAAKRCPPTALQENRACLASPFANTQGRKQHREISVNISPQWASDSSAIQSQDLEHSSDARADAAPKDEGDVNGEAFRRRYERIAKAAYRRAQQRAFAPGGEVE